MAQIVQSKFPIDSIERKAVGFGFPLNGNAVFKPTYTTREQIRANIINFLLTNHGERVFNPFFGGNLRNLLFEHIDNNTLEDLEAKISDDLGRLFPGVTVQGITFTPNYDENSIFFDLTYEVIAFGIEDTVNIQLQ